MDSEERILANRIVHMLVTDFQINDVLREFATTGFFRESTLERWRLKVMEELMPEEERKSYRAQKMAVEILYYIGFTSDSMYKTGIISMLLRFLKEFGI